MKKLLVITSMLITMLNLVSEEIDITILTQKEIIKLIDSSILKKDESIIIYLGTLGSEFPSYGKYEKYILVKALELAQGGDLSYPLMLVEAVLYNNLENSDAQKLYAIIIDKKIELDERLEAEKIKAEQKREELASQVEEMTLIYAEEERMANIVTSSKELLSTINGYIDSFDKSHYVSNSYFYPILSRFYTSEVYDGFHNRESTTNNYNGFALEFGIGIALKFFVFRMDMTGNISYNDLLYDNIKQITGAVNISMGIQVLKIPIYVRTGFLYDTYMYDDMDDTEVAITSLPSPSIGLGITGLRLFKVLKLDLSTDVLLASLNTDNLDYALSSRAYITLNLLRFSIYNLEIRGGLDNLFYMEGGLAEYSFTPRFGFGISSYE